VKPGLYAIGLRGTEKIWELKTIWLSWGTILDVAHPLVVGYNYMGMGQYL
jgi:hypothetical protein